MSSEPSRSTICATRAVDLGSLRDVGLEPDRRDIIGHGDLFRRRLGTGAVEIGDRDRGAILREPRGGRRADAAGAAGDQRDPSFRPFSHGFSPCCLMRGQPVSGIRAAQPPWVVASRTRQFVGCAVEPD
jgi:hypothetical protein